MFSNLFNFQKQKEASGGSGSVEQSSVLPGNESKSKFSITDAVKGKKNKNKKQQNVSLLMYNLYPLNIIHDILKWVYK